MVRDLSKRGGSGLLETSEAALGPWEVCGGSLAGALCVLLGRDSLSIGLEFWPTSVLPFSCEDGSAWDAVGSAFSFSSVWCCSVSSESDWPILRVVRRVVRFFVEAFFLLGAFFVVVEDAFLARVALGRGAGCSSSAADCCELLLVDLVGRATLWSSRETKPPGDIICERVRILTVRESEW